MKPELATVGRQQKNTSPGRNQTGMRGIPLAREISESLERRWVEQRLFCKPQPQRTAVLGAQFEAPNLRHPKGCRRHRVQHPPKIRSPIALSQTENLINI